MAQIGGKVRDILLVRHARNRLGGRKPIQLTEAAMNIATGGAFPSQSWFARFFGFHAPVIDTKVPQKVDAAQGPCRTGEGGEEGGGRRGGPGPAGAVGDVQERVRVRI